MQSSSSQTGVNRTLQAAAAVVMQICLGILYAWSVFRGPLAKLHGWPLTVTIAPYRWSILFFTIAMVIAGFWQDKKGPRLVGTVGGVLLGTGCLLASLFGDTPTGLIVSYGVIGGLGVGFAYVTPIATCVKWFPDKRGFVVGLAVMGFGVGSLIFAPLLEALIGKDPAHFATTIPRTFLILAAIFYVLVTGCAQVYRVPPPGWKPEGWTPPVAAARSRTDYTTGEMVRTWQFYAVWVVYFLGSAVGLTVIGEAAPLINTVLGEGALLTGAGALGVMSLFNGVGRLVWGAMSDKAGRKTVLAAMAAISLLTCAAVLPGASAFVPVLAGICLVGFCYGGYLAVMPTLTADYYGPKYVGANYGILFSAWGAAGFIVPGYLSAIVESARQAGETASGYNQVFYILAGLAAAGGVISLAARRPE
ncbi:MAG: OFA family MFS transporter [Bryobacteraceae bacterium]